MKRSYFFPLNSAASIPTPISANFLFNPINSEREVFVCLTFDEIKTLSISKEFSQPINCDEDDIFTAFVVIFNLYEVTIIVTFCL